MVSRKRKYLEHLAFQNNNIMMTLTEKFDLAMCDLQKDCDVVMPEREYFSQKGCKNNSCKCVRSLF